MKRWLPVVLLLAACSQSAMGGNKNPLIGTWVVSGGQDKYPNCAVKLIFTENRQQFIHADGSGAGDNHLNITYNITPGQVRVIGNTGYGLRFNFKGPDTVHWNESGCDYTRVK